MRWSPPSRTCSRKPTVNGQEAAIASAKTDIALYVAAEKTAQANVEHAKPTSNRRSSTGTAPRPSTKTASCQTGLRRQEGRLRPRRRLHRPGRAQRQPGQGQHRLGARSPADRRSPPCASTRTCSTAPSPSRPLTASSPTSRSAKARPSSTASRTPRDLPS